MLLLIGALDYFTGSELSVSLLYALTVLSVAWFVSRRAAMAFALMSTLIWWWANRISTPYTSQWGYAWATLARFAYFLLAALGGSALRSREEFNRQRIEALERAVALEHEVTRISEHEQRKIGQDLHDGICQELAAIAFALSSVRDDLAVRDHNETARLDEVLDMLRDAISETRNLARGIFPAQLEEIGLAAMLDELVCSMRRLQGIDATFEMQGEVQISDPEVATHLYRIAQEALGNAVKHGGAPRVWVSLTRRDDMITLEVADEGGGLPQEPLQPQGMGLKTMDYRARIIGASIEIRNKSDRGVSVICRLPVKPLHRP